MARYGIDYLRAADINAIHFIDVACFPTPWSADTYLQELRAPQDSRYVVARFSLAEKASTTVHSPKSGNFLQALLQQRANTPTVKNGAIVGHAGIMRTPTGGHITTLAVHPQHRGQGVGELLLLALIEQAYDLDVRRLALEVRSTNLPAQRLYTKYGFVQTHIEAGYYRDNGEDALSLSIADITALSFREHTKQLSDALYRRFTQK